MNRAKDGLVNRSPLKEKPLRNPGQSVRRALMDIVFDKLMAPLLLVTVAIAVVVMEWIRYFFPLKAMPWLPTALGLAALGYFAFQYRRFQPQIRALKLAEEGEKAVGQFLEGLREKGYQVFHDIISDDFNVDHVLIGPAGVFTIETKTRSKPQRGKAQIDFDGETLKVGGYAPDRDPIVQALAQATWLKRLLTDSTGKAVPVRPVVLFPGWFINDSRQNKRDLWVLEPKALSIWLGNEKAVLAPDEVAMASQHLSRYVRFQERLLDQAS
ncbi:MAG: nuclease-related domain-containing protein [Sulfuritalea sp.]|nr:nuclease-related domain-containing protein [Sulfuritalea sp.]